MHQKKKSREKEKGCVVTYAVFRQKVGRKNGILLDARRADGSAKRCAKSQFVCDNSVIVYSSRERTQLNSDSRSSCARKKQKGRQLLKER